MKESILKDTSNLTVDVQLIFIAVETKVLAPYHQDTTWQSYDLNQSSVDSKPHTLSMTELPAIPMQYDKRYMKDTVVTQRKECVWCGHGDIPGEGITCTEAWSDRLMVCAK